MTRSVEAFNVFDRIRRPGRLLLVSDVRPDDLDVLFREVCVRHTVRDATVLSGRRHHFFLIRATHDAFAVWKEADLSARAPARTGHLPTGRASRGCSAEKANPDPSRSRERDPASLGGERVDEGGVP